jgi:hypothetical protein
MSLRRPHFSRLVAEREDELDDAGAARSCAEAIQDEVGKDEPNRGLLAGMTVVAGSVGAIADAAGKIRQALGL